MKKRAVFLDRDGTLNEEVGYPRSFEQIRIFPYSYASIRLLNEAGFLAVVVTNQSGIGRGLLSEAELRDLHQKMGAAFARHNARIDAFYHCPHLPWSKDLPIRQRCGCRKPQPGMVEQAAADFQIDPARSYVIGDKVEDVHLGHNIGALSILVLTGHGQESLTRARKANILPSHIAPTLEDAVNWILNREGFSR